VTEQAERDAVDRVARSWIGTPYHDHGEVKGAGVDCGKLLKCVFVEAGLIKDFTIGYYSPQHFLHREDQYYLTLVERFLDEVQPADVAAGDVALYWIGKCFAHGAIVVKPGWPHIVHAHSGARMVRPGFGTSVHLGLPIQAVKFFSRWPPGGLSPHKR
jgi:hypothetical protein